MKLKNALFLVFIILLIDQWSKIYIKTNLMLHQSITVFDWFKIYFIENEGAAWGTKIPGAYGKLILTTFRIVAVCGIAYWLLRSIRNSQPKVLIVSISLILAGALGNIIDSVFYGVIFNHSYGQVATIFSEEPYGTWFHGKVVDMLYFPLIDTKIPEWIPILGGKHFRFFEPVFNVADTAISVAVGLLIIFNKKAFPKEK